MAGPRMLFAVGRDSSLSPFYHLIVTVWFSVSCWQMSFLRGGTCYLSVPQISLPNPPPTYLDSSERERERLQRLGLVVTYFPAFAEVTRRCQIWADNWSIRKLWRWQALSPLRLSPRMGQRRNNFTPNFLGTLQLQINTMWCPNLTVVKKQIKVSSSV